MRLYWQKNSEETIQLSGDIQLAFDGCDVSTVETTVSVSPAYEQIIDNIIHNPDYNIGLPVTRINGVQPTDNGEFSIEGSECTSWDYDAEDQHKLVVVDLCPSCTTCETVYRLRYETENLRLWLNTLKDVNLILDGEPPYTEEGTTYYTMLGDARYLSSVRITGATALSPDHTEPNFSVCMSGSTVDTSFTQLRGLELLKQYITLVHMWNYVVSQNNSSTEIQIAPEDTVGFVVQTKRALPSCGNLQKVRCTIIADVKTDNDVYDGVQQVIRDGDTTLSDLPVSPYYLSVYVPTPSLDFQPFDNSVAHQCIPGSTTSIVAIPSTSPTITSQEVANVRCTYKKIDTGVISANVAGTYVLRAKFLPYIDMTLKNADGTIVDIRGTTSAIAGSTATVQSDGSIKYSFIDAPEYHINPSPTEDDYLRSKTGPTRSVNFKLVWVITVKWLVCNSDGSNEQVFEQTYNYTCNGVREYYGANMESVTLSPLLPTPGGTTSTGGV